MKGASWELYCECPDGAQCPDVVEKLKTTNQKLTKAYRSYGRILKTLYLKLHPGADGDVVLS